MKPNLKRATVEHLKRALHQACEELGELDARRVLKG